MKKGVVLKDKNRKKKKGKNNEKSDILKSQNI